ncbi:NifB/NifX family molybdenum-iron cluster-binding protein [Pelodictyon phaeoclathratiforme]|jgi:predicted Fe-Mo cluster-binding NifX family protein|uniref:Dinitrogenase iron-molybdenum cofactor biosynthesis protein n=1 Tax=Pelodictyon phaeoclathratiforme (strain DSM 5477 / BU-1) TaxID=324925 RepID=B4SHC2_PELPB|nr:NifB/NifX family molybdenum-iron cluster-binding protein [Pelodictyon phaeoclathratiforme]ACF43589.1 Dinitrogenase iron-molybdenum cofactor biosynthesis protein [Pelodictyon phaeoclathratiforme BU-1]MBV5289112.1 NifB/NifX family molybdenum-iron cluster-binding protein [Pelodictyon phaeoclathratiforme]
MKVIIPLIEQADLNSKLSEHFGSAPFFAVADMEKNSIEIIPNASMHHDHGQCTPADFFSQHGIDVVLCNGIGAGAIARLQMMGIDVYMAELSKTLQEALTRFSNGLLAKVTPQQACQGHGCH